MFPKSKLLYLAHILETVLYCTETHRQCAYHEDLQQDEALGDTEMMEITGIGMGLMMTGVAVAAGGLLLEAALLMMCRSLRPPVTSSTEPAAIYLS